MYVLPFYNPLPTGASNVMVRADVLAAVGAFDTALRRTEDWDMWIRLARTGPPAWVRRPLVAYQHHRDNTIRDVSRIVSEPGLLAEKHGIDVDLPAMLRRAAWASLQDGKRVRAVGYYLRAAARGDVRSLGRAAVAMTHPAVGTGEAYRLIKWTAEAREWAAGAESWLAPLRAESTTARPSSSETGGAQPPGLGL
jgi:hypothetical protein